MNFTAIDVETANTSRGSVCAVGMAQVRAGRIVRTVEWHVRPHEDLAHFEPRNIAIHGITPKMVKGANSWAESLDAIRELAGEYPLVAYNAPFDRDAILQATELALLEAPTNNFHCALALSRRLLALDSYKLSNVATELGIAPFDHHRPGADAAACAQVVLALAEREGAKTVADLWSPERPMSGAASTPDYWSKDKKARLTELPQPNPEASGDHPFHGQQVIFTGELEANTRWEAMEFVAHHGGINGKGITKKTGFLVVGGVSSSSAIDLTNGTAKERKAATYIEQGQNIRVITEREFLRLVDVSEASPRSPQVPAQLSPASEVTVAAPSPTVQPPKDRGAKSAKHSNAPLPLAQRAHSDQPSEPVPTSTDAVRAEPAAMPATGKSPLGDRVSQTPSTPRKAAPGNFVVVLLWLGVLVGGLGAIVFGAAGISLLVEGTAGAGWTGIIMGGLCAGGAWASLRGILRRRRARRS